MIAKELIYISKRYPNDWTYRRGARPQPLSSVNQRSDVGTAQGGAKCRMQLRKQLPLFYPSIFCHYIHSFIFDN